MQRILAASLVPSHDFNFHAERHIMIVGDDPIGETIEVEVSVQHSYYVDAFKVAQQVLLAWCPW